MNDVLKTHCIMNDVLMTPARNTQPKPPKLARKRKSRRNAVTAQTTDQFSTSFDFWVLQVENMRRDINQIKTLLVKFENILVTNQTKQLEFMQKYFDRQTEQLKACQEAFQLNVDRDEELRTTMLEAGNPWDGC